MSDILARSPKVLELLERICVQSFYTTWHLEAHFTTSSDKVRVSVRTDTKNPKLGWLVGRGSTLEEALEDYAHEMAVRLER